MAASTTFVVSALIRRKDHILLVEEREPGDSASTWMLPGGKVEADETLVEALRRELAEETGMAVIGSPRLAFWIDITREGRYSAVTFDCAAEGSLVPDDPDGLILGAEWVEAGDALSRLACVAWYDCIPLERYLSGEEMASATHIADRR